MMVSTNLLHLVITLRNILVSCLIYVPLMLLVGFGITRDGLVLVGERYGKVLIFPYNVL